MMDRVLRFFAAQRQIFGLCPRCQDLFRLSDCRIYSARKPTGDWMDDLVRAEEAVERQEERFYEKKNEIAEVGRKRGRIRAAKAVRAIDTVFSPRKIQPEDVKTIFHPIDYLVFRNQNAGEVKSLVLLDRNDKAGEERRVQRSIERTIEKGRYEWQTLRVSEKGFLESESVV
jgi:predicted Holliday junction resolvase-like endonuclease